MPPAVLSQPCEPSAHGCGVGAGVGAVVGAAVGLAVGACVGAAVGYAVGLGVIVDTQAAESVPKAHLAWHMFVYTLSLWHLTGSYAVEQWQLSGTVASGCVAHTGPPQVTPALQWGLVAQQLV